MAGKAYGKHKTLAIYDFFRNKVGTDDKVNGATLDDIRNHLIEVFDDDFERKSIYADIDTINEYRALIGQTSKKWIDRKGKGSYIRNLEKDDFTMDEIHALVDAVNASPIVDEKIAKKIKKHWPAYFKNDDYVSFLACAHQKPDITFISLMNSLRKSIKTEQAIKIRYGFKLTDKDPNNCIEKEHKISPIALYYADNKYYLYAIDNDVYASFGEEVTEEQAKWESIRQYRIDRISKPTSNLGNDEYISCDVNLVRKKIEGAVDAYSSGKNVDVMITLEGDPELIVRAFTYLRNEIGFKSLLSDRWQSGKLVFFVTISPTPTFFTTIMNLSSFSIKGASGVKVTIKASEEFQKAYEEFLENSKQRINFVE